MLLRYVKFISLSAISKSEEDALAQLSNSFEQLEALREIFLFEYSISSCDFEKVYPFVVKEYNYTFLIQISLVASKLRSVVDFSSTIALFAHLYGFKVADDSLELFEYEFDSLEE
ncbi:MAG: hypothetical protein ACK5L5_04205 [Bacteroidales bacterium]